MYRTTYIQTATEFLPIVAFFVTGQLYSFLTATIVLMIGATFSLIISLLYLKNIPYLPLFSATVAMFFGGISIWLTDPDIIIFADTFYFLALAAVICAGFYQERHFLERVFHNTFAIHPEGWRILSQRWLVVLIIVSIGNEIVRILYTPEIWIDYRLIEIALLFAFAFYQFRLSARYRIDGESNSFGLRITPQPILTHPTDS